MTETGLAIRIAIKIASKDNNRNSRLGDPFQKHDVTLMQSSYTKIKVITMQWALYKSRVFDS